MAVFLDVFFVIKPLWGLRVVFEVGHIAALLRICRLLWTPVEKAAIDIRCRRSARPPPSSA
jgi:hypothetical protein